MSYKLLIGLQVLKLPICTYDSYKILTKFINLKIYSKDQNLLKSCRF